MTLQIGNSITGAGTLYNLGATDDIFVPDYANIIATTGNAIDGTGSGRSVTVRGSVFSDFIAIDIGDSSTSSNNHVFIAAGGFAGADLSTDSAAVRVRGSESSVVNDGSISAFRGIILGGHTAGVTNIANAGTIYGSQAAIILYAGTSGDVEIENSGTIIGGLYSYNANNATATERIYNIGSITGDMRFQGGDDLFDNDGGTMRGLIDFGAGNDELIGGDGRERAMGGADADDLDFAGGKDIFLAGNNDVQASDGNDDIDGGDGIDTYDARGITTRVSVNLEELRAAGADIGIDYVVNFENIRGGSGSDILVGDEGRNVIRGGGDIDFLLGNDGNDRIFGNDGDDFIRGGIGRDVSTGGDGIDTFIYNSIAEAGNTTASRDIITDFVSGTDKINLSVIDANSIAVDNQAFSFIGVGAFTGVAGQLHYVGSATHLVTVVEGDINGDSIADFQIALFGNLTLAAGDFIL